VQSLPSEQQAGSIMAYTMHTYAGDFRAFKGMIAAQYSGVEVDFNADFKMGKDNNTKAFKAMSPMGKVPVLETPKGALLESNAIARFLARHDASAELMGCSFFEQAQVESWIDWCSNELEVPVTMWIYPLFGFMPPNPKQVNKATKETKEALKVLEAHLKSRSFMVGNKVTLADIVLAAVLTYPFKMCFDGNQRKGFPCVTRWFMTLAAQPEFVAVIGDVLLCGKKMELPKPKKKEKKAKKQQPKKKKQQQPKPEKEEVPAYVTYLKKLPRPTYNLETFKKAYSNSKSVEKLTPVVEAFLKDVKGQGFTLWKLSKGEAESKGDTVDYMMGNAVTSFNERCDEIRRYAFGVMIVLDTLEAKGHYTTTGIYVCQGDQSFVFDCNPECSLKPPVYNLSKLDLDKAEDTKLITDVWTAWDDCGGQAYVASSVFK